MSAWGYDQPTTPELERLAASAIRYDQAIAPAPWTLPSLTSMFTGLFPSGHGVVRADLGLSPDAITAAEILSLRGYETALFGVNAYLEQGHGLAQGFRTWDVHTGLSGRQLLNRVQAFLAARNTAQPLYLVVHFFEPHCRYRAPDDRHGTFEPPSDQLGKRLLSPRDYARMGSCYQLQRADGSPELDLAVYQARYDEEVLEVDSLIGRLWRSVSALEPWFAVVADHGEAFWEHGDFGHGRQLFQEQIRVPMLIRPVGGVQGRVVTEATSTLLLAHRLLSTAGVSLESRETLVALSETDHEGHRLRALVRDEVKIVQDLVTGQIHSYDLRRDAQEQVAIEMGDDKAGQVLSELFDLGPGSPEPIPWQVGPETAEALKALGYTEASETPAGP
jgi:arylsulfatase A-like enzyme